MGARLPIRPLVEMDENEVELIASFTGVPINKVRGIIWLAEWRMRDEFRKNQQYEDMFRKGQP